MNSVRTERATDQPDPRESLRAALELELAAEARDRRYVEGAQFSEGPPSAQFSDGPPPTALKLAAK